MDLIRSAGDSETKVECLLSCGHWSTPISHASSAFDFPDEPHNCDTCGKERQWDLRLQAWCYDYNRKLYG
jgi:hypothetical protein